MSSAPITEVTLASADGVKIVVNVSNIKCCVSIRDAISDIDETSLKTEAIQLAAVSGVMLQKVVDYCNHYGGMLPGEKEWASTTLTPFESEYIEKLSTDALFELMHAADYLVCEPLTQLCGKRIALMIKGKDKKEIKQMLGITREYTQQERDRARKDPGWLDDPSLPIE